MTEQTKQHSDVTTADATTRALKARPRKKVIKLAGRPGISEAFLVSSLTAKAMAISSTRPDLVADVRARMASGTYETPEILDGALDALATELDDGTFE